ncbi:hypothetical protein EST38_g3783 [Candolleomyces aberdarensis]|uniref:Uncharacterized protein n=1 Tax=Candolleomyces aberdarensis TaxID=2316362 RepID=A0A4Q2DS73_9AGAR|nr:hypothetical protein EST38_g3783 [Candolleomyces aberdarensis]
MTSVGLPSPTTQSNNSNDTGSGTNVAPIVGGVVGGIVGLAAVAMLTWYFFKKSTHFDRIFNRPDDFEPSHHHNDKMGPLEDEVNAKGYQYGLVGHEATNPGGPPSGGQEVGMKGAGGGNEIGYQPNANETGYYQPTANEVGPYQPTGNETGYQDPHHVRTPSLAPLLTGLGAAAAGSAAGATAQSISGSSRPPSSGRPSTGGSTYPLIPQGQQQQQQQQGYPPQGYGGQGLTAYPPSSGQSYGGSQGYYGSDHGHSYGGSASGHSTNPSMGSWNGAPAQSQNNMIPVMVGGNRQSYIDPENRAGSPVSIQEQRVLQVINPDNSYTFSSGGGASSAVAGGSSSSGAAYSSGAGSSSAAASAVDGKGRPINFGGEKAPLVHLDGGRYEEPHLPVSAGGPSTSSGDPAPPAYSS